MNSILESLIQLLQTWPPESILVLEYLTCAAAILGLLHYFGKAGIYAYIALAVIVANIQVLKTAHFSFMTEPVALGTIVFSSTFLASDILTEFYGAQVARKAVWIGFFAMLFIICTMTLTLSIKPAEANSPVQQAINTLFSPVPAIFAASLISFLISQYSDIWIFQAIRRLTGEKYLWLRTNVSSLISAFIDNTIFSSFAWVIFSSNPVDLKTLVFTYILGTYLFRVVVTLLEAPLIYGARQFIKRGRHATV